MAELVILRGLPGVGKTTKARAWVAEDRANRIRVNRDDLRMMADDGEYVKGVTEGRILALRDAMITQALKRGLDVVNDDTNLPARTVKDLAKLAYHAGADFRIIDMTDVPLSTCLDRNASRQDKEPVPGEWIYDQYKRFIDGKGHPLPVPDLHIQEGGEGEVVPYVPDTSLPKAIIVDIDGTVALKGTRDAFDETRVHEDRPNMRVIEDIRALWAYYGIMNDDLTIIFMSGRTDGCREATRKWLEEHVKLPFQLYMRAKGDGRKDWIVKNELFSLIRDKYNVLSAWDDRNQVVHLWRNKLNLQTYQVSDGAFLQVARVAQGIEHRTTDAGVASSNLAASAGGKMEEVPNILLSGIVGSHAYGLATEDSDVDRLGFFAYPTEKILGIHQPEQSVVRTNPDVTFHEAGKFISLALRCNPTITELLWLPEDLYETRTPLGDALIGIRQSLLSATLVRNAYLGYATQQFRRLENRSAEGDHSFSADTKKRTAKHARHLLRLLDQGSRLYHQGELDVRLNDPESYRKFGDAVAAGDLALARMRISASEKIMNASEPGLPDRPDYAKAQEWLLKVRREFW